jgi:hypothetical protein
MTVEVLPVSAPEAALSITAPEVASFDERWAAWQAKGAAHDRAVRQKMAVAVPILIAIAAVILYVVVGR